MHHPMTLVVVAFFANAFAAVAGGGVGLIQLPLLLFLGLPYPQALATHKVASVALGVGAGSRYARAGVLEPRYMMLILVAGLPGVWLGSWEVLTIPAPVIRAALGILTVGLGLYSFSCRNLGHMATPIHREFSGLVLGGLGLFVIGVLNGSVTSGTGLFCTLWLVWWFGFDYKTAVAYTLTLVGLVWNATGAVTLGSYGLVQWQWLPWLLVGALSGSYLGAHGGLLVSNRWIKRAFELLTIAVGVRLLV